MNRIVKWLVKYSSTEWNKGNINNPAEIYFHRAVLITNILMNTSLIIAMISMIVTLLTGFGLVMQFSIIMLGISIMGTASVWFLGLISQPYYFINAMKS